MSCSGEVNGDPRPCAAFLNRILYVHVEDPTRSAETGLLYLPVEEKY